MQSGSVKDCKFLALAGALLKWNVPQNKQTQYPHRSYVITCPVVGNCCLESRNARPCTHTHRTEVGRSIPAKYDRLRSQATIWPPKVNHKFSFMMENFQNALGIIIGHIFSLHYHIHLPSFILQAKQEMTIQISAGGVKQFQEVGSGCSSLDTLQIKL